MATYKQFLLSASGCSGRGVRIRMLSAAQRAGVVEAEAKRLGPEASGFELDAAVGIATVCAVVVAYTKETGFKKAADLVEKSPTWVPTGAEWLDDHYAEVFNAKDVSAIVAIFRKLHIATDKEIEDILGEALDVTSD